jgi:SAM-dependent methyltransferase
MPVNRNRNPRLTLLVARAIMATGAVDRTYEVVSRGYQLWHRLRSELISTLASDAVLDRLNDLGYDRAWYRPHAAGGGKDLFPWEESAIRDYFPGPPGRILVGGAGGGREAFVLATRGYDVVAFEPSRPLVAAMAHAARGTNVDVRSGGYEEMDVLLAAENPGSFDAAILGWFSFSHLRNDRARVATLKSFGRLTRGPILISFAPREGPISPKLARLRRLLPHRNERDPDGRMNIGGGLFHGVDPDQMRSLARQAGLEITNLYFPRDDMPPHAVLKS